MGRFLPLAGMLIFFAVGFAWRAWSHRRRFGHSGVMLFRSGIPGQRWRDALALGFFLISLAQAASAAIWPSAWEHWSAIAQPAGVIWRTVGATVLFGGIVLLALAQRDLGKSWRIGIEETARPGLVCEGLFRISRNPIFSAVILVLGGYAMLLPTRLSVALLLATIFLVRSQVDKEETYLRRSYPDEFAAYASRVGRFLPGLGRLK